MSDVKLTPTQLQILRNIRDFDDPFKGFSGMAASGGAMRSLQSLFRKGLVEGYEQLSEAGRAALEAVEERIRGRND
jgi:hypothetical protein